MEIIGLGGEIGAGKSTLAGAFTKIEPNAFHIESWHPIGEVADAFHEQMPIPPQENNIEWMNNWLKALPPILKNVVRVDCDYDQLAFTAHDVEENVVEFQKLFVHSANLVNTPELAQHKITEENKPAYRPILQWLGGYLVSHVKPTIWYDEILRRVETAEEYGADLAVIGGIRYRSDFNSVKQKKATVIKVYRPDMPEKDSNDPTERERNSWEPDIKLYNNGTVEQLEDTAPVLLDDIRAKKAKKIYFAAA